MSDLNELEHGMKHRIGDALFWVFSAIGLAIASLIFLMMSNNADSTFDKLSFCGIIFSPFFGVGWLIRYVFTGRTDLWINPTRSP